MCQIFEVAAAQTSGLVNLVFAHQTSFFKCEHSFVDKLMIITELAVPSSWLLGLGSNCILATCSESSTKILLNSCRVFLEWRKTLLAGCSTTFNKILCSENAETHAVDVWLSLDKIFLVVYEFHHTLSQIFHIYQEIVRVIKGIVSSCFLDLQPSRIWSCIENKFFVYGDPKFTASLDRWNVIPACHCNTYSLKCTLWSTRNKRAKIISPSLLQVTL